MKSPYVNELAPNQVITACFLVQSKEIRQKKTGDPYLSLILGDRTGELEAKMWDNVSEAIDIFERDDFVKVKGLLQVYQNRLQLTIHKMAKVQDHEIDFVDFFPASERNPEEMWAELQGIVREIGNPHLRALLEAFLGDEKLARAYRLAPAAKHVHHAFLGGLLEHVLSLCHLSKSVAPHYKDVDVDLLLAGAILHDIGKTAELSYDRSFGYTSEGQLLGHIVIGLRMLNDKLTLFPGFPEKLRVLLEHLVVSHHGELEFGSPKVPLFLEALLLHHLDNLDSKMECMRAVAARDRHVDGFWTGYSAPLERAVFKKQKYMEEAPLSPQRNGASTPIAAHAPEQRPPALTVMAEKLQQAFRKEP